MTVAYKNYFKDAARDWHHATLFKRTAFKPFYVGKYTHYPKAMTYEKQLWSAPTVPWSSGPRTQAYMAQQKWRRNYYSKRN